METKKIVTIVAVIAVVGVIAWQAKSMFGDDTAAQEEAAKSAAPAIHPDTPKQAALIPPPPPASAAKPLTPAEIEANRLQQEAQVKYLAALDDLQMLKVEKDIAETNKDIMKAKEDMITSQHKIVDMLAPKAQPSPVSTLDNSGRPGISGAGPGTGQPGMGPNNVEYSVVSVTNLRGRWTAIINTGSKLVSVTAGDVMSDNNVTILSIDRSGVLIEKDGNKKKIVMPSVI
jgi:hypothetical protein